MISYRLRDSKISNFENTENSWGKRRKEHKVTLSRKYEAQEKLNKYKAGDNRWRSDYLTNGKLFHYSEPAKCRSLVFVITPMAVILICHASHRCSAVEAKHFIFLLLFSSSSKVNFFRSKSFMQIAFCIIKHFYSLLKWLVHD